MKKELDYFGKVLEHPERPFLAILGSFSHTKEVFSSMKFPIFKVERKYQTKFN